MMCFRHGFKAFWMCRIASIAILGLYFGLGEAAAVFKPFAIKYVSKDNVYLKGGRANGLSKGDTLEVRSHRKMVATLLAVYVSKYSASCKALAGISRLKPGQLAHIKQAQSSTVKAAMSEAPADSLSRPKESDIRRTRDIVLPMQRITSGAKRTFAGMSGYAAYQQIWEFPNDPLFSSERQQYRVYLRMRRLMGKPLNFKMSLSSYKYQREHYHSEQKWNQRLSAFSLNYEGRELPLDVSAGRLSPRVMSGVGYIDGGLLKLKNNSGNGISLFGGKEPDALYYHSSNQLNKYGGYAFWKLGRSKGWKWENWLGWAGEYKETAVSREYLYLENEIAWMRKIIFRQSGEFDINRDWRKSREGNTLGLTNLYLDLSWRPNSKWHAGVQYDTRKRYYEYDNRTLADSLFDLSRKDDWRMNASWRVTKKSGLYMGYGIREMGGALGYSHLGNLGFNVRDLFWKNFSTSFSVSGSQSEANKGYTGSCNFRQTFKRGSSLYVGYGLYRYWYKSEHGLPFYTYSSRAFRTGANLEFPWRIFASGQYEYAVEHRENRHRFSAESGYRF